MCERSSCAHYLACVHTQSGVLDLNTSHALQSVDVAARNGMVKFPDDFWDSLKGGDTSDWVFWVDIGIIIGLLFLLLCFVRCCMWCFDSKKNDEKYDPNIQDMKPAPDWLQHQNHSQNARMPPHVRFPAMSVLQYH